MKTTTKLWAGLVILIMLSPVGLLLPDGFKAGAAWGEWGKDEIQKLVGYVPQGFEKLSELWRAPLSDYAFKGWEAKGPGHLSIAYIVSAVLGMTVTVVVMLFLGRLLIKDRKK